MATPPCDNCTPDTAETCRCPCHLFDWMSDALVSASPEWRSRMRLSLGTTAFFTQMVCPGDGVLPDVSWPCQAPIITVVVMRHHGRVLGANFWN
jgi:hypothetical protein